MKKAFTLIELSLVLIIMAVVIAVISSGTAIKNYSNLRATIAEFKFYQSAYVTFNNQFGYPPGDLPNAFNIWGSQNSCTNNTVTVNAPTGCNGNGDNIISWSAESSRAWQHLALAQVIPGTYTGIYNTGPVIGVNNPRSIYPKGAYDLYGCQNNAICGNFQNANILILGGTITGSSTTNGVIGKNDAFNIDNKLDDGMPLTGDIRISVDAASAASISNANCATGTSITSVYNNSVNPQNGCSLAIKL